MLPNLKNRRGFTLLEIIIGMVVIGILATAGTVTLTGLLQRNSLQKGTDMLRNDVIFMRSRAVSILKTHRLTLLSNSSYVVEQYDSAAATWSYVTLVRNLPVNVVIRAYDVTNKASSLEFPSNGLPNFNGKAADPFYTVIYTLTDERKGIYIEPGGAIYQGAGAPDAS